MYVVLKKDDLKIDMPSMLKTIGLPSHIGESDFIRCLNTQDGNFHFASSDIHIVTIASEEAFKSWVAKIWTKDEKEYWTVLDLMDQMDRDYIVMKYNEKDEIGQKLYVFDKITDFVHFLYQN